VGYKTSAGAIVVALNNAIENKIYNPNVYNISFEVVLAFLSKYGLRIG
jgi:hypothetical protein